MIKELTELRAYCNQEIQRLNRIGPSARDFDIING